VGGIDKKELSERDICTKYDKLQERIEESRHQSEILTESVVHHLLAS